MGPKCEWKSLLGFFMAIQARFDGQPPSLRVRLFKSKKREKPLHFYYRQQALQHRP